MHGRERGHSHHQPAVLHAFQADDEVGEVLHAGGFAVNDQHFKAGIEIEMRMARGDDEVVVLVLRFGQLLGDSEGVMVVNESDGADNGGIGRGGLSLAPAGRESGRERLRSDWCIRSSQWNGQSASTDRNRGQCRFCSVLPCALLHRKQLNGRTEWTGAYAGSSGLVTRIPAPFPRLAPGATPFARYAGSFPSRETTAA